VVYGLLVATDAVGVDRGCDPHEVDRHVSVERVLGVAVGVGEEKKAGWISSEDKGEGIERKGAAGYNVGYGESGEVQGEASASEKSWLKSMRDSFFRNGAAPASGSKRCIRPMMRDSCG
jgi:hypothetical protein